MDSKASRVRTLLLWAATKRERWQRGSNYEAVVELLLIDPRVNANTTDVNDRTPLSWTAGEGYYTRAKLILAKDGVDLVLKDYHSQTPQDWAEKNGHKAVVEILRSRRYILS